MKEKANELVTGLKAYSENNYGDHPAQESDRIA